MCVCACVCVCLSVRSFTPYPKVRAFEVATEIFDDEVIFALLHDADLFNNILFRRYDVSQSSTLH